MLYRDIITVETDPDKLYDITEKINSIIESSKIQEGLCHIFIQGTTSGLWINENDRLLAEDVKRLLNSIVPKEKIYQHPENAFSHLRASLFRGDCTMPVAEGRLALGEWQSVTLWNFDSRQRMRRVIVTIND